MGVSLPTPLFQQQPAFMADVMRGHPLARNLRFAGYSASGRFYDAVSRQASTLGSTANRAARRTIDGNVGLAFEAKTTQMTFPAMSTGFDQISGPCSIFVEGSVLTNNTSQLVAESFESGSGNGFGLKFDDNNQVTNGLFLFLDNSNSSASNFDVLGVNSETFRHRVMITLDGVNANIYAKNKLDIAVANTAFPTANSGRQTRILTGTGGAVALVLVWDRALSLAEYQSLFFNPWALFSAPRKRFTLRSVTGSPQSLGGSFIGTDEAMYAGRVAFSTSLTGSFVATDEATKSGAVAISAVALAGQLIKPDEKVNQGSISSLPYTALWTSPASTNFSSVVPGTVPAPGGTAYVNVMAAWGGGAVGGGYFIIAALGGHTDYSGNEVYALRLSDMTPVLLRNPCSAAIIAASDSIESSGLYATSTGGTTPDPQQPRSAHGYDLQQWSSAKNKYARIGCNGLYPSGQIGSSTIRYYDPSANTWETGPDILTPFDGAFSATCEDASGNLWFIGQGSQGRLNRIVPSTGVVTEFGDAFMFALTAYYRTGIHDPVNNRFWIFGGDGLGGIQVGYWDLTNLSGFVDFTAVTPTGDTTILGQPAPGVAWYAADSKFVLWSGGSSVVMFDPTTFKCLAVTLNPGSVVTPSAAQANGTFGRFRAIGPNTFLGVNAMTENFYMLQLRGPDQALTGATATSDEQARAGAAGLGPVALTAPASKTDEQASPGAVAAGAPAALGGTFIFTDESALPGSVAPQPIGLPGVFIKTDESAAAGTIAPQPLALAGLALKPDEQAPGGSVAALFALLGASLATDERTSPGALALAAVTLAALALFTDENAAGGTISQGGQVLSGSLLLPDERAGLGSLGLNPIALAAPQLKPDESAFPGSLAAIFALAASAIATDEKTNPGALAVFYALTGSYSATNEQASIATVAVGGLALAGISIATDDRANAGTLSQGGQVLGGSQVLTDEQARPGSMGLSAFSLTGALCKTDEQVYAASLGLLYALQGAGVLTDEQTRAGAAILGGSNLGGAFIAPDEAIGTASVVPAATALLGASIRTDERTLAGAMGNAYALVGASFGTDEALRTSIVTVGAVTVIGQYTATDELVSRAVVVVGQLILKTVRARGPYKNSVRRYGPYV